MSSKNVLLQAVFNRLRVRLQDGVGTASERMSVLAKDLPERFSRQLDLFQEEVIQEVNRLEDEEEEDSVSYKSSSEQLLQAKVDALRRKIAELNRTIEAHH